MCTFFRSQFSTQQIAQTRALRELKLRQDQMSTESEPGFESGLILIWLRMPAGSLPKCFGFIALLASVMSPSLVQIGRSLYKNR